MTVVQQRCRASADIFETLYARIFAVDTAPIGLSFLGADSRTPVTCQLAVAARCLQTRPRK